MPKKRILVIASKDPVIKCGNRQHFSWIKDCRKIFNFDFWGPGFSDTSLKDLERKIDQFKPDYTFSTLRRKYSWMPNLSSIKGPCKIFTEVDTFYYNPGDKWYDQFDLLVCRQQKWGKKSQKYNHKMKMSLSEFNTRCKTSKKWKKIPLLMWSVPEISFKRYKKPRRGVWFYGKSNRRHGCYQDRRDLRVKLYQEKLCKWSRDNTSNYWRLLARASGLICPTESNFGDFVPQKLFEFVASGAAVFSNCDVFGFGAAKIGQVMIKYEDTSHLIKLLKSVDRQTYYDRSDAIMREHTHRNRFKKLFE
jgi:hypothetical protein